jgi:hypothetical protein
MTASAPVQTDPEGKVDENSIPKSRVDVMIAKATAEASARAEVAEKRAETETERRRDLEARNQPATAPPPPQAEKAPPTRQEMQAAVDAGTIEQGQMDAELERQMETRVEQKVADKQGAKDRGAKIGAQIDEYMARVPDLDDPTSDNHKRVRAEFTALRKLDYANDATTELAAIRAVLGDLGKVKIPEEGPEAREVDPTTHAGGGGGSGDAEKATGPGPLKGLEPHFVEYYTEGVKAGRYSGWDDPQLQKAMAREVARK